MPVDWAEFELDTPETDWSEFSVDTEYESDKKSLQKQMTSARSERRLGSTAEALAGLGERAAYTVTKMEPLTAVGNVINPYHQQLISPEQARKVVDFIDPFGGADSQPGTVREGVKQFASELISGLSQPEALLAMGTGKVPFIKRPVINPKLPGVTFLPGLVESTPQMTSDLVNAETPEQATKAGLGLTLGAAGSIGAAAHIGAIPEIPKAPPITGRQLTMPEGVRPIEPAPIMLDRLPRVNRVVMPEQFNQPMTWEQEVVDAQRMAAHGTPEERALAMERLKVLRLNQPRDIGGTGQLPEGEAFPRSGVFDTAEDRIIQQRGFDAPEPLPEIKAIAAETGKPVEEIQKATVDEMRDHKETMGNNPALAAQTALDEYKVAAKEGTGDPYKDAKEPTAEELAKVTEPTPAPAPGETKPAESPYKYGLEPSAESAKESGMATTPNWKEVQRNSVKARDDVRLTFPTGEIVTGQVKVRRPRSSMVEIPYRDKNGVEKIGVFELRTASKIEKANLEPTPTAEPAKAQPQPTAVTEAKPSGVGGTKGIVSGGAVEAWADNVIKEGKKRMGAGLDPELLAAHLVKGVALIERGIINFAEWSARMIAEHGPEIKPHLRDLFQAAQDTVKRAPATGTLKSSREIVENRIRAMTEGEDVKMRRSAARATESPAIPEPVQEKIAEAPESFYKVQPGELVEQAVKKMSDTELLSVPAESNLFVASRLEAASRLFNTGQMEKGYDIFVELEKQGTSFGQNINQFKRLPGTLPEHTAFLINQRLKKAGKDPLTKPQEAKAIELTKVSKESDAALDKATRDWMENPTDANARIAEDRLRNANQTALDLQKYLAKFEPRSLPSILKSILQGNLLTPISEVANLVGNMSFLPFRAMDRTVATGFDIIDNAIRAKGRQVSVSPIGGTAEAAKGAMRGLATVPNILRYGSGDVIKGETRAGLHPVRAWINQFAKNPEMATTGGKLTLKDRIGLALEGTFGVPAEMMLRGLGAGDAPFKEAAHSRVITEQLRLKGIPKNQWNFARQFPELFFDRATMEQIKADTLAAVFQRNSHTIGLLTNWLRGKGDAFDLAISTVAPYKLTPWNLVGEILSYNPVVALSRAMYDASKGNSRSAKLNAGKLFVGSVLTTAGWWLYKNGLLSPSLDERTEAQKARVLADEVLPPNHINISGLKRKLEGGDPSFKAGDRTVDIFRAGGLAGSIFYMAANIGRDFERQPESQSLDHIGAIIRQSTLEQARFGLNQSFLSGVEGLLTAVKDGNTDSYIRRYMNTVLSIPFPNSMATLSRATRKYQPDFRDAGFTKQVENTVRNKLGFAGLDDYMPLKRGLWGEPLPQTPKGANELFYHFFDVTKGRQVTDDPVALELYRLWRKTGDTRAIPSLPDKTLTVGGQTYDLTADQRSRYAELVGKYRRQMATAMVINPGFQKLGDEQRLDLLETAYRTGQQTGKALFYKESKGNLQAKPERAGFK